MKNYLTIFMSVLLSVLLLAGCNSNSEESLLNEDNNTNKVESENKQGDVIFGKKTGERNISAKNVFSLNEDAHFVIHSEENFGSNKIQITINRSNGNEWAEVTSSELEVKQNWNEVMNGLPSKFLKQIGPGGYQLVAKINEEVIAKGEFVLKKES